MLILIGGERRRGALRWNGKSEQAGKAEAEKRGAK
jgi:hypothetical protein